jgi:hypothetical protein
MSVNFEGGVAGVRPKKLTGTGVTDIVAETNRCLVKKVYACEVAGSTPALSLMVSDGTTTYYLMCAKPMTARQTIELEDIPLETGWKLQAQAGAGNQIDIFAVIVEPGAG